MNARLGGRLGALLSSLGLLAMAKSKIEKDLEAWTIRRLRKIQKDPWAQTDNADEVIYRFLDDLGFGDVARLWWDTDKDTPEVDEQRRAGEAPLNWPYNSYKHAD